jgi:hypothetical protein
MFPTTATAIADLTPTELNVFVEVDQYIVRSVASGDPLIAINYGLSLKRSAQLKGIALAKLLHGLQINWGMFRAAGIGEEFEDFVYTYLEIQPETSRKYASMWAGIFMNDAVSPEIKEQLQTKPIEHLLLLTAAVEEGSITNEDLREAAIRDKEGIREMVSKARGNQTSSKTAIRRYIQMRDGDYPAGTIIAAQNGDREILGVLNLEPETEFGQKALAGLLNSKVFIQRS